ncbi:ProQ/FINO family protein [Marinomonas algarum]|uniref:ProQ/FinO family protein n=1 Tax=Marinomonas algarum TaxID=2883105 RepID=A0A9X1INT6_9GAMM|nr:ProQ/FINO family protein [Marinomonas algarum]MCB5162259.1 ProQ/FinO family protein [Marinomonas algarum]
MEQLIAKLEAKIDWLTQQLRDAHEEIQELKGSAPSTIESSTSMDLLQQMADQSNQDQLQLYIEDSLDLLDITSTTEQAVPSDTVEQHRHDVLHEHADSSTTTTTTEQIDYMTTQQPELNGLQEDGKLVETQDTSAQEPSDTAVATETATVTLTPEQRKRQKNQKNNRRLIKMLEDRYPKAFDWNQPKPLKVGIDKDMVLDDDFNASKQKRALAAYTRSDRYKKCLLTGQPRVDLEGVAVNNEPALPESMLPKKAKTTMSRPWKDKPTQQRSAKPKQRTSEQSNDKAKASKPKVAKQAPQQDTQYDNLSPEERMKAKLEKLLNKS